MSEPSGSRSCDVVVIGGGLSGLRSARTLVEAGLDVLVLEAQDRVGDRTLTTYLDDGTFIDDGGQYVSPGQDRIVALAEELSVELFPTGEVGAPSTGAAELALPTRVCSRQAIPKPSWPPGRRPRHIRVWPKRFH
jgi:monoamine oxidase